MALTVADRVGAIGVIKPMALPGTPMAEYLSDPPTAPAQRFEGAGVSAETPGAIAWGVSAETGEGLARVVLTDLLDWDRREEAVGALMGRFAAREDEVDDLFRLGVFTDLYRVVRKGVRAGVENYSIKRLEPLCGYCRRVDLAEATASLIALEAALEDGTAALYSGHPCSRMPGTSKKFVSALAATIR